MPFAAPLTGGREVAPPLVVSAGYCVGVVVVAADDVAVDDVPAGGGGVGWVGGASTVGSSIITVRAEVEVPAAFSAT
jgi:hypothetical protein